MQSIADAVQARSYQVALNRTGGEPPYAWSVIGGSLPPGVGLDPNTGVLSGTPTVFGVYPFTVQVTDSFQVPQVATQNLSMRVVPPLVVTVASLRTGIANVTYAQSITATGGTPPYAFVVDSGSLPPGLSMDINGNISGVPTTAGTFGFSVFAGDSGDPAQRVSQAGFSITVTAPLQVTTMTLPRATQGLAYSTQVTASGGLLPFNWAIASGSFPPGLNLDPGSGNLSGSPTAVGSFTFTAQVTDASLPSQTASQTLMITVSPQGALTIVTPSVQDGLVNQPYSTQIAGSGGQAPYTWSLVSGMLPSGLSLDPNLGSISGTPSAAGSFAITLQVADVSSPQQTATRSYAITISTPLSITTMLLPGGAVSSMYSATVTGTGGILPYAWSIAAGMLPPGLTLDPASGTISGVPTSVGSFPFTLRLTDSGNPAQTTTTNLAISTSQLLTITTMSLPNGTSGVAYSGSLGASGGTTPYAWSIESGAFPPGLSLDSGSGSITGTPTTPGTFTFTARVTDSGSPQQQASEMVSITVM